MTTKRGKKRSRPEDTLDPDYTPNQSTLQPMSSAERRAATASMAKPGSTLKNVTLDQNTKIPAFLASKNGRALFSAGWWSEMSQTDAFWEEFAKRVSEGTIRRRFSVSVNINVPTFRRIRQSNTEATSAGPDTTAYVQDRTLVNKPKLKTTPECEVEACKIPARLGLGLCSSHLQAAGGEDMVKNEMFEDLEARRPASKPSKQRDDALNSYSTQPAIKAITPEYLGDNDDEDIEIIPMSERKRRIKEINLNGKWVPWDEKNVREVKVEGEER